MCCSRCLGGPVLCGGDTVYMGRPTSEASPRNSDPVTQYRGAGVGFDLKFRGKWCQLASRPPRLICLLPTLPPCWGLRPAGV